ncbi:MAG TPA: hypothetical protein VFL86_06215 [Burkholderiaceae bacterium]|nr:hypothetical protein [Burkholderiaceae bacterium]
MQWTFHSLACGGVLVLALGSVSAQAAEPAASAPAASKPAPKSTSKSPPKKPAAEAAPADMLTRDQLRACMAQDTRNKAQRQELADQRAALDKDQADIQGEGQALKQALETLDRTSEPAVLAYKARVEAKYQRIDAYNARVQPFSAAAAALREEELAYIRNCSGRPFEERDELAIKRGK